MSENNFDALVEKLRNGERLTVTELSILVANPQIFLDNFSPIEAAQLKLRYGFDITPQDIEVLRAEGIFEGFGNQFSSAVDVGTLSDGQLEELLIRGMGLQGMPDALDRGFQRKALEERFREYLESQGIDAESIRKAQERLQLESPGRQAGIYDTQTMAILLLDNMDPAGRKRILEWMAGFTEDDGQGITWARLRSMFAGTEFETMVEEAIKTAKDKAIERLIAGSDGQLTREAAGEQVETAQTALSEDFQDPNGIVFSADGRSVSIPPGLDQLDLNVNTTQPIGVPLGHQAIGPDGELVDARYFPQHIFNDENGRAYQDYPLEQKLEIQALLIEADLLEPGSFRPGQWDLTTRSAFEIVLGEANANPGETWQEALKRLAISPETQSFDPGTYLKPDPAYMAGQVRDLFIRNLGRLPTASEMFELSRELELDYRLAFEASEEKRRAQDEAERTDAAERLRVGASRLEAELMEAMRDFRGGPAAAEEMAARFREGQTLPNLDEEAPIKVFDKQGEGTDTVQDVDPESRLEEEFFRRYGPLIEFNRQRDDASEARSSLMQSLLMMDTQVGGR